MSETIAKSESATARPEWTKAKRIVVKIGSALLTDRATGELKAAWLASLMDDVAALTKAGKEVILVSSGAVALGRHKLGRCRRAPLELEQSQAAAAVGQISLAHAYPASPPDHGLIIAQILLTLGDTEQRRRYLNARHTIETLLELKAIPVVNENDTVATAEIRYGDNDRLSARVASMMSADLPGAALRHRRPLYRAARVRQQRRAHPARHRDHGRDRGHGAAMPAPSFPKAA